MGAKLPEAAWQSDGQSPVEERSDVGKRYARVATGWSVPHGVIKENRGSEGDRSGWGNVPNG